MQGKFERWIANFGLLLAGVLMWVLPIYAIASLILYNVTVGYYPWHLLYYFVLVLGAAVCGALGSIFIKIALYKGDQDEH